MTGLAQGREAGRRTPLIGGLAVASLIAGATVMAGLAVAEEATINDARCKIVAHIGDSTSVGMTDPQVVPTADDQLPAKYKAVAGVEETIVDAVGGRAIVEQVGEASRGVDAMRAAAMRADCFVVALGVNDALNIASGSQVSADSRIEQMLAIADGKPVMWPTVKTTAAAEKTTAAAAPKNMEAFNAALLRATSAYPNLAVFQWDQRATEDLFSDDGIHYTAEGTQARIDAFSSALKAVAEYTSAPTGVPPTSSPPASTSAESTEVIAPADVTTTTVTVTVTAPAP